MKASDLFVKCLESEGVQFIFGVPGEENLDFLESLRTSTIKFITTRHEQAAVFMAATMGRLTGKAGVALSTLGPGATNLVTGVAYAQLGGMPLLVITGQKPIRKSKQGKFQILDIVRMMEPLTKLSTTIVSADRIPSLVHQSFKLAQSERPGAVHLELPEDVAADETDLAPIQITKIRRPGPDPKAVTQTLELIQKAKSPLLLIASGANRKLIRKHLQSFIKKTGIPFVTTQMGKGVLDETDDLYLGTTALSSGDYIHCALNRSDCIIMIGHDIIEKPPVILTSDTRTIIHINFSEAEIDDVYVPTLELIGDVSHSVWALSDQIQPSEHWDFQYFKKLKNKFNEHLNGKSDSTSFPVKPQHLVKQLREALPGDGVLALDNGMYKIWIARNYPAIEQNTVLLDNALATMGAGLPAAIGVKLLYPDRKVIAIVGDGGLMMSSQELETAKRLNLDLVVLIVNDSGYGMIRWKQEQAGFDHFGLTFENPDFVQFAKSFGVNGVRINKTEELGPTIQNALNVGGIHLIDCPIDYSENERVFEKELKEQICTL